MCQSHHTAAIACSNNRHCKHRISTCAHKVFIDTILVVAVASQRRESITYLRGVLSLFASLIHSHPILNSHMQQAKGEKRQECDEQYEHPRSPRQDKRVLVENAS